MTNLGSTFKTGQVCVASGVYEFAGYTDGSWAPSPTSSEREIPLAAGNTFPLIRSANKGCWWRLTRHA